ncbi:LytTR family DNA-binding domain-containing protein [Paraglaciecola aquimarina]|uniref:LytTR family DNA-binding domain-containing protein n=1 Tax=Paraglaciecola aquimarina TaxID=1235557 RepID=A0ABU3SW20_9ALTE|nr:LytTR family DNA-binding domain-containing protein [Paraglaciecola aquimarina]MDU0354217.1 LytTR family DNA-binding domain-containing protein [Paraglaciecola aquimarina]
MTAKLITAIVVDDEPLAIEGLRIRLENIPDVKVIGEATDGDQAIKLCQALQPDVLFLDLRLPGLNGLEVVQVLQADVMPMVVFVSAYSEYALDAFELNAIDYIMKPANLGRLQKTMERVRERLAPKHRDVEKFRLLEALGETSGITISELEQWLQKPDQPLPSNFRHELVIKNTDNERVFVAVKDIRWIDAAGDYMCIHTEAENFIVRITMKSLESELDSNMFCRIHKSTLVNIQSVRSIQPLRNNESMLDLGDQVKLKVSRSYSEAVTKIIQARQGQQ